MIFIQFVWYKTLDLTKGLPLNKYRYVCPPVAETKFHKRQIATIRGYPNLPPPCFRLVGNKGGKGSDVSQNRGSRPDGRKQGGGKRFEGGGKRFGYPLIV